MPNQTEDQIFAKYGQQVAPQPAATEDGIFSKYGVSADIADRPAYANGLSPDAAVNRSPLSATDRLVIKGLGNRQEDIEKSLKQRFAAVQRGKDGEFRVKNTDGLWYQVDPDSLEGRDAIDVTRGILRGAGSTALGMVASLANTAASPIASLFGKKLETNPFSIAESLAGDDAVARETVGELAENTDTIAMIGAGIAAPQTIPTSATQLLGISAAGGASAAVTKLGLTSLGRLEGTYDATPEEQLTDASYEFGLGMLGTFIPAGARFGLDKFASSRAAANATKMLSQAPEEKMGMIKSFFEGVIDDTSIDRLATPGNKVQSYINQRALKGGNLHTFQDDIRLEMVKRIKEVSQEAIDGLHDVYTTQVDDFLKQVPAGMKVNTRDITKPILDDMVMEGLAKRNVLTGAIEILPFEDLVKAESARQLTGAAKEVAFDRKTYDGLSELFDAMNRMNRSGVSGKEAVVEMMSDQRVLRGITKRLQQAGKGPRIGEIENDVLYRAASKYGQALKDGLPNALGTKLGEQLRNVNSSFRSLKQTILPLEKALANDTDALRLATAMTGKTAAGTLNRASLPMVVSNFTKFGGLKGAQVASKLTALTDDVADMKAAIQFTAPMRAQFGPFQAGMAGNMMGDALKNESIKVGASLGIAANVLSKYPKAAKMAVNTKLAMTRMLEGATKNMGPSERAKLLFNGDVLENMTRAAASPLLRIQTQEALAQQAGGQQQ